MEKQLITKFGRLLYFMTKHCAKYSFTDFLEHIEVTEEEFDEIMAYLKEQYGIKTYF